MSELKEELCTLESQVQEANAQLSQEKTKTHQKIKVGFAELILLLIDCGHSLLTVMSMC